MSLSRFEKEGFFGGDDVFKKSVDFVFFMINYESSLKSSSVVNVVLIDNEKLLIDNEKSLIDIKKLLIVIDNEVYTHFNLISKY